MRIKLIIAGVFCIGTILVPMSRCLAEEQPSGSSPKTPSTKKTADPLLSGPPFTFEQLLRLIHQSTIPPRRRQDAIQRRGLAFLLSSESVDKLKASGASEELLEVIKSKASQAFASCPIPASSTPAPPSPPPPKRPPEGKLAIRCAPAECEISLNDSPRGSTHDGLLEVAELPVGQWTIAFKKSGYLDRQAVVTVEPDAAASISEVLNPNRATQEAYGAELFQKVVRAIGLSDTTRGQLAVEAVGATTTWTSEGRSIRSILWMRNQPERALFQIKAGRGLREVAFIGGQYTTSKRLKAPEALQLASDAGLIRDNQLSALIARLRSSEFTILANHNTPAAGEEFGLIAEGGAERISIALDGDLLPRQVRMVTATGAGSRIVSYADYAKFEGISYPKTMQIKPEGSRNSLDVHFDTVTINSTVNAGDYKLKRKPILAFKN
jgi:hypothetical protein